MATTANSTLSTDQLAAYEQAVDAIEHKRDFCLTGAAGTGKTTIIQEIASDLPDGLVCAPTGKACEVLGRKGIEAKTLHSWLYAFRGLDAKLQPIFASKRTTRPSYLIVDEASMVTEAIHADIKSKAIPTIYVGDNGQLPPVHGQPLGLLSRPDYELTEIHRQAAGSPIIQLAHSVRGGGNIFGHPDIEVASITDSDEIAARLLDGMDRVIVRTNDQRVKINQSVRELLGRRRTVQAGDQLICLANDYTAGILNGQLFTVRQVLSENKDTITAELSPEYEGETAIVRMLKEQFGNATKQPAIPGLTLFDYGWAITGHKSQGSQWNHVGVFAYGPCSDHARWNYTAITRAQNTLTVFRYRGGQ